MSFAEDAALAIAAAEVHINRQPSSPSRQALRETRAFFGLAAYDAAPVDDAKALLRDSTAILSRDVEALRRAVAQRPSYAPRATATEVGALAVLRQSTRLCGYYRILVGARSKRLSMAAVVA